MRVAVLAFGAYFRAAAGSVPGKFGPVDFGLVHVGIIGGTMPMLKGKSYLVGGFRPIG
jgi:hypothetical protein